MVSNIHIKLTDEHTMEWSWLWHISHPSGFHYGSSSPNHRWIALRRHDQSNDDQLFGSSYKQKRVTWGSRSILHGTVIRGMSGPYMTSLGRENINSVGHSWWVKGPGDQSPIGFSKPGYYGRIEVPSNTTYIMKLSNSLFWYHPRLINKGLLFLLYAKEHQEMELVRPFHGLPFPPGPPGPSTYCCMSPIQLSDDRRPLKGLRNP